MSEPEAVVESARFKLSPIWLVPLAAVVLGIWLAVQAYLDRGPVVEISFPNATGIEAAKTRVKVLDVDIGLVTRVRLGTDSKHVVVTVELNPEVKPLLREDTQFWVVRPRVQGASVSGLGTLLSGAFIEMAPGVGKRTSARRFDGLAQAPATPVGTPGVRLTLTSATSGSVGVGSPIVFHGYQVGLVESVSLDLAAEQVSYSIFVDAPYDTLITSNTRFWNASGISAELTSEGFKLSMSSLQSTLVGGVAFDLPREAESGDPVRDGMSFRLYPDEASIHEDPYRFFTRYVVGFEQSLRGLHSGAPVTYRGIRIGSVERILLKELEAGRGDVGGELPVLIRLEPGRMEVGDSPAGIDLARQAIEVAVSQGLRATLETGNLLTGALYVGLDFYDDATPESMGSFLEYDTIPAINAGFSRLQAQLGQLLAKLNELPLEAALTSTAAAFDEVRGTLDTLRQLLAREETQAIPGQVNRTLESVRALLATYSKDSAFESELNATLLELKATLESLEVLADRIADQPNALVFPSRSNPDPQPEAKR